ncbi:MAG: 30S ribosomal protein S12 methylthiotransferase RimO [Thermogutta sp.]|nr:30S ribosomal protein S12 methylthiotransferase RimO [Thermogutta sp.]
MPESPDSLPILRHPPRSDAAEPSADAPIKGTCSLIALGCPKNLVDGEHMLGLLEADGYRLVTEPERADVVIVNTCGFLQAARQESFSVIEDMLKLKRRGRISGVIVAGCLAERDRESLLKRYPDVDQVVGLFAREEIVRAADRILGGITEQRTLFQPASVVPLNDARRVRVTPRHLAYLKISEGCDRLCTFCTIPHIRGRHVTKPMEDVVAEARTLAADGVRELIVVAQDTTYYGLDLYGRPMLAELLRQLRQIEEIRWIRLMYSYPMYFTDELIEVLAEGGKILPYLDIPLQHISDRILRRMKRRVGRAETEVLLDRLRSAVKNLVLRTTMIAGFPGETEREFEELIEFVREQRFERLGVFEFSREPGTPADRMKEQLPRRVIQDRRDRLMAVQQKIIYQWSRNQVGRKLTVLLDQPVPGQENVWLGRSYADAPEIDGAVYVTGDGLRAGQFVECEIVAAEGYDLAAAPIAEAAVSE